MDIYFLTAVRGLVTALLPDHKTEVFKIKWYPVLSLNNLSQGMTTGNQTNDAIAKKSLVRIIEKIHVSLLSALFSEQTIEPKDYGLPAVLCVCMFFILYIPPFIL